VSRHPSGPKTTKGSLQSVSWTHFLRSRKPWMLFTTLLLESQTSLQNNQFPPVIVRPWRTHKSTRGPMYNLMRRELNLTQRLQYISYKHEYIFFLQQNRLPTNTLPILPLHMCKNLSSLLPIWLLPPVSEPLWLNFRGWLCSFMKFAK